MAIYELREDGIEPISQTTFSNEGVRERGDLQRLLRERLDIVLSDTMVIAEEFGDWEESRRRIDLLALDKQANLVVIELKRTEDGGHMELQAIRYAAMVSAMTFEKAVTAHARFLKNLGHDDDDAQESILTFLEWDEPDEEEFAQDVRIVLVSEDFSKELTTAVIWLNERMLDIRCIRLKPYSLEGRLLVDVQQVIPLPEAAEYQVQMREKEQKKRSSRWKQKDLPTIWKDLHENCSEEEIRVAHDIYDWLKPLVTEIFPTANGFAPLMEKKDRNQFLFKVMTNGQVQIWFHYLKKKPPFADEGLRKGLLSKLNLISGVEIGEDRLIGKPSFPLGCLADSGAMDQFKEAFEWAIGEIKKWSP